MSIETRSQMLCCPSCSKPLVLTEGGAYCRDMRCGYARGAMPKPALGELYALGNIAWGRLQDRNGSSKNRGSEVSRR